MLFSRERGDAAVLARQAVVEGAAAVVACGGDGTIAEMLPALAATGVPLGVLPCGTANDFARVVPSLEALLALRIATPEG